MDYAVSPDIRLQYDALNRLTNMVDAVGATRYAYTAGGQVALEDGPWENDNVSYGYNSRARTSLTLQQPNASPWSQSYVWDVAKRLRTNSSPAGQFTYMYPPSGGTLAPASSLHVKRALPNGAYITNAYDSLARLTNTSLKSSNDGLLNAHAYIYNSGNQRTRQTRTFGDYVEYGYDDVGQLKTAIGKESGGTTNRIHEQMGYYYDNAGNLLRRTNNVLVQSFSVNALNQLTNASRSGTLTVAGNTTLPATSVTVNTSNAIRYADATFASSNHTLVNGTNVFSAVGQHASGQSDTNESSAYLPDSLLFSYDGNGDMQKEGNTIKLFSYDDENQLIAVTVANAWKSEFTYDGKMRRRIRKEYAWRGGVWVLTDDVRYIYDSNLVIQERDGSNLPQVTYTRGRDLSGSFEGAGGIGGLLARTDNVTLELQPPLAHAYYDADANGNITMLINSNQTVVASYLYDPFGNILAASGLLAEANVYRFSSMELHKSSGVNLYRTRPYEPKLQRWLTREPYGDLASLGGRHPLEKPELLPDGANAYLFVHNNPVLFADADGRAIALPVVIGEAALLATAICYAIPACRKALEKAAADALTKARDICRDKEEEDRHEECKKHWLKCDSSKYPCFSCYHQCVNDGAWDSKRCPLTLSPP